MKHTFILSLLLVMCFLSVTFANEEPENSRRPREEKRARQQELYEKRRQAKELAREVLAGRQVAVRVYNNWQKDARVFEWVTVPLKQLSVGLDAVTSAFGEISEFAVIVVTAEDQKDEAVAAVVGDFVYAELYKKGKSFSIWPKYFGSKEQKWWTFNDALGNPIAQATVEILLRMNASVKSPRFSVWKGLTDEQGRLKTPVPLGNLKYFSFIISHLDYGIADVDTYSPSRSGNTVVALVRKGTDADQRAVWGVVVGPEGNPVSGATIHCWSVQTLGGGLVLGSRQGSGPYKVISDEEGRFRLYLPIERKLSKVGKLIPPKSKYQVRVEAPAELGLFPYRGEIANFGEVTITMEGGGYFHTFAFEDANGPITDPNRLKRIEVRIHGKHNLGLKYEDWKDGEVFPLGTYRAKIWVVEGSQQHARYFQPLEVTADSPEELVFTVPKGLVYYGRVVHGITGEPMPGVFVVADTGALDGNLSRITPDEWQTLHSLPANPPYDDPRLAPLRKIYSVKGIVRTNQDGYFQVALQPGQDICKLVAFEEDYLGFQPALKREKDRRVQVSVSKLFPAAKVMVEPRVEGKSGCIEPYWIIDTNNNPTWVHELLRACDRREIENPWLRVNQIGTFHVPAGLNLRIQVRVPYSNEWQPITIAKAINLRQGEVIDLGRYAFEPPMEILVKVVDSAGNPVEGVPVMKVINGKEQRKVHNTDENGIVRFRVPTYSSGEFVVQYYEDPKDPNSMHLRESVAYEVGGEEDVGRQFTLQISDEMLYQLFK